MTADPEELDERHIARLRAICLALPETEEVLSPQGRPLFRVRHRRFALYNGDSTPPRKRWLGWPPSLHFLSEAAEREALNADRRFRPSPHHGNRGWLAIDLDDHTDWSEVAALLAGAYREAAPNALLDQILAFPR